MTAPSEDMGTDIAQNARDYARIEAAILYLEEHFRDQPGLDDVAREAGLSPHHFQRLFRRWAGISPKRFGQYLTLDYAKDQLEGSASILDAAYDAGLSGPSRLHDLFVTYEAMSPGAFKRRGEGVEIALGRTSEPLRSLLCRADGARHLCAGFRRRWRGQWRSSPGRVRASLARRALPRGSCRYRSRRSAHFQRAPSRQHATPLAVAGTNFQLKVWEALLRIPPAASPPTTRWAQALGLPRSARAVGGAVAANPVSYLIPCHRVIRHTGRISHYEWGRSRKRVMLGWEAAHFGPAASDGA